MANKDNFGLAGYIIFIREREHIMTCKASLCRLPCSVQLAYLSCGKLILCLVHTANNHFIMGQQVDFSRGLNVEKVRNSNAARTGK